MDVSFFGVTVLAQMHTKLFHYMMRIILHWNKKVLKLGFARNLMRFILHTLVLWAVASCGHRDSFYEYYRIEDLSRIPLVQPYEATNVLADGDPRYRADFDRWWIEFKYRSDSSHPDRSGAMTTRLNVEKGIIYGSCAGTIYDSRGWFVIIPSQKIEKTFLGDKEDEWKSYLQQRGITPTKLQSPWEFFDEFVSTKTLPWYNPKKNSTPELRK